MRSGTARSATSRAAPSWSASPVAEKVLAIFTTDTTSDTETVVARYADRWPIEVAIAGGKQLLGIGQARNRLQLRGGTHRATEFCVYSLVVVWYTLHGYHPDDLDRPPRRSALVLAQGRHRLRRHARQTSQNPCRSTNYGR